MKRLFKILLILFLVCLLVLALAAWLLPGIIVEIIVEEIPKALAPLGLEVADLTYDSAHLASWRGATVTGVAFSFGRLSPTPSSSPSHQNTFDAREITVIATSLSDPAVTFAIENFNLTLDQPFGPAEFRFRRLENAAWREDTPVRLRDALTIAREALADTKTLFREGRVDEDFDIEGLAHFQLFGKESQARIYTASENGAASLCFDEADVRAIAQAHHVTLGDAEVTLVAENPLKMPGVIEITTTAQKSALAARRTDPSVPEDAYRHTLWSYLLTDRFGAEFAKIVTDAHETVPGNTPEERAMDYHNNAVGRRLAARNIPRNTILETVKTAPEIIRSPQEVLKRPPASLLDQP
jgi:hypothetical protein